MLIVFMLAIYGSFELATLFIQTLVNRYDRKKEEVQINEKNFNIDNLPKKLIEDFEKELQKNINKKIYLIDSQGIINIFYDHRMLDEYVGCFNPATKRITYRMYGLLSESDLLKMNEMIYEFIKICRKGEK